MNARATVVIVGRTNVGKSSLFNRLSSDVKSMTLDFEGVTRDFIRDTVCWKETCFDLVDTGGVSFKKAPDAIGEQARQVALSMLESADQIIFVVDGSVGIVGEDREIAKLLHKLGKPVIMVVNKIDVRGAQENFYEFERLGFPSSIGVSCTHGSGTGELLNMLVDLLPTKKEKAIEEKPAYKVVLLGKPNVGKSSLLNLILNKERAIVSDVPGTTREALSENIMFYQEDIQITDTPGIRKKSSVRETLETMMVKTSLRAVEDADIVLLLIDASAGQLADQELKLAFYAFTQLHKAVILLFNKQDLVDESMQAYLEHNLELYEHLLKKVEKLDISCKTGKNIGKIMPLVHEVWARYNQQISDHDLTILCREALTHKPLFHKTLPLKIFRVRQVKTAPVTLLMIVNQPRWFQDSQLGYFDNVLRKRFNFKGVPLKFIPRTS
jgi:GTPase